MNRAEVAAAVGILALVATLGVALLRGPRLRSSSTVAGEVLSEAVTSSAADTSPTDEKAVGAFLQVVDAWRNAPLAAAVRSNEVALEEMPDGVLLARWAGEDAITAHLRSDGFQDVSAMLEDGSTSEVLFYPVLRIYLRNADGQLPVKNGWARLGNDELARLGDHFGVILAEELRGQSVSVGAQGYETQSFLLDSRLRYEQEIYLQAESSPASGKVIEHGTRRPVAGAYIRYGAQSATTNEDGEFYLPAADGGEGADVALVVKAAGYRQVLCGPCDLTEPVLIEIRKGATVEGRVTRGGHPVEGLRVKAKPDLRARMFAQHQLPSKSELRDADNPCNCKLQDVPEWDTTDEMGSYSLSTVPGNEAFYALVLQEVGSGVVATEQIEMTPPPGGIMSLDIQMPEVGRVQGTVSLDGRPCTDAVVQWSSGSSSGAAKTDASGAFTAVGVPVGEVALRLRLSSGSLGIPAEALERTLRVSAGAPSEVDFIVVSEQASRIAGRLVSWNGVGLGGATLKLSAEDERTLSHLGVTDSDGRFDIDLEPRRRWRISAQYESQRVVMRDVESGTIDLVVTLEETLPFILVAVGPLGEPVQGCDIFWRPRSEGRGFEKVAWKGAGPGRYAFEIYGEQIEINVRAPDAGYVPWFSPVLESRAGEAVAKLDIGARVQLVLDTAMNEEPPSGVVLFVESDIANDVREKKGAGTRFPGFSMMSERAVDFSGKVIGGLAPGDYRLVSFRPGLILEPEIVRLETNDRGQTKVVSVIWREVDER